MAGGVTPIRGGDVNDKHRTAGLPADPLLGARAVSRAARADELKRQLAPVSLASMFAEVLAEAKAARPVIGASLGHYKLDKYLCGLRRGNITTLGARTSFGKTSKALQVAHLCMRDGGKPLFISCEDSRILCAKRFMSLRAKVNALRLRANQCRNDELERIEAEVALAETFPFFANGIGVPVEDICDMIRQHCREHDSPVVIVDYLQCIQVRRKQNDRRNEVGYIANELSAAIKQSNAAGLLLSQMRRAQAGVREHAPTMDELKESGDIENASEHVLLGWAEAIKDAQGNITGKTRRMQIAKNKDGPSVEEWLDLEFDSVTASIKEVRGELVDDPYGLDDMHDDFQDLSERRHP